MVHIKLAERRGSVRVPGSYPVRLWDARKRPVGRGKTANISERGVFVLLSSGRLPPDDARLIVEMDLPRSPAQPRKSRRVCYSARVVRTEPMGQWGGVALELLDKID